MLKSGSSSSFAYYAEVDLIQYRCPSCQSTALEVIKGAWDEPPRVVDGGTKHYYREEDMRCVSCGKTGRGKVFEWRWQGAKTVEQFFELCDLWERDDTTAEDGSHRKYDVVLSWQGKSHFGD